MGEGTEISGDTVNSQPARARLADDSREVSFAEAAHLLLRELMEDFPSQRTFFLEWGPPAGDEGRGQHLEVLAALESDGSTIEHPDYHLDLHYIREIGSIDGARLHGGPEEGVGRALLSCAFPLHQGMRGVLLLEGAHGAGYAKDAPQQLESHVAALQSQLVLLHSIALRDNELARLHKQLDDLAQQLELRELELGTARPRSAESRFFEDNVTTYHQIITRSPAMRDLFDVIERVKDTDINVMIVGETGTGKELVARALHYGSNRASRPFEVISSGSIPVNLIESELFGYRKGAFSGAESDKKGVFERASGGTVFLDELGDMPAELQQKLLRVLQESVVRPVGSAEAIPVHVRVISATRQDLSDLVARKQFREDLYYRLNVITLEVPSLRDRREDIPLLLDHFVTDRNEEDESSKRFSESALRELHQYSWPGNVQELKNLVTRAFLSSNKKVISRRVVMPLLAHQAGGIFYDKEIYQEGDQLHLSVPFQEGFNEIISECEKLILITALRRNRGNKSRVTQQLGIPRQTLYNKLEKYGILEEDYLETEQA